MRPRPTLGLLAATAAILAGCATVPEGAREASAYECPVGTEGCDTVEPVGDGGEMTIASSRDGEFSFDVEDGISVTGDITVTFVNEGAGVHNVDALGAAEGSEVVEAGPGDQAEGVVKLFPGEWTIICNIPGHRASGMETTVRVFATAEEAAEAEDELADEDLADVES